MGAKVVCVARSEDEIEATASQARKLGSEALAVPCDVTEQDQLNNVVEKSLSTFGGIDILINNAGAPGRGWGSLEKVDMAAFEHTLRVNLTSAYTLVHLCTTALKARPGASIVNVSSAMAWMVDKNFSAYAAAKAGMNQMTRVMAYELAPTIRVNAIAPGAIETPATEFITSNPKRKADTERWIPAGKIGQPKDIALGALYLASSASDFVSGKVLEIDGGMQALPGSAIQDVLAG
jgi:7-alpha-hydroxysteroid dehydrogenase